LRYANPPYARDYKDMTDTAASVARMSEAISGFYNCIPACRFAHAGYLPSAMIEENRCAF
jgi:hypothetical protein